MRPTNAAKTSRLCSRTTWVLLSLFPIIVLLMLFWHPVRREKHVLFDLLEPEHNGELISVTYQPFDYVIGVFFLLSIIGFVVGLVLLCIALYKRRRAGHVSSGITVA